MGTLLKTMFAFCVGLITMIAAHHYWASSVPSRTGTSSQKRMMTQSELIAGFTFDGDNTVGRPAALEGAIRQAEMQRPDALSSAPVLRLYPGMPRY